MDRQFIVINNDMKSFDGFSGMDYRVPCTILDRKQELHSIVFKILRKIHLNKKINSIVNLPLKYIWAANFENYDWKTDVCYYVVFDNSILYPLSPKRLNELAERYNIHYVLLWCDQYDSPYSDEGKYYCSRMKFDYIFTINQNDADKYGFLYSCLPYAMLKPNDAVDVVRDCYFVGAAKDRLDKLLKIYSSSMTSGVNSYFLIMGVDKSRQLFRDSISYIHRPIPYLSVLDQVKESNCLLEMQSGKQTGATLRYYEAVCYNKKLLTNNKNVVNLKFYDPRFMQVYECAEDIDWNWVKKKDPVDYHYDGSFSISKLLDKVLELEDSKVIDNQC